jgi:uncharacterized protein YidB (DUF937 family)
MSMDLFGQLLKGLAGTGTSGPAAPPAKGGNDVLSSIFDMLGAGQGGASPTASAGGLTDLVKGFQDQGLGDVISSWIGTGENRTVTPDQVRQGLGKDRVQEVAQRSGLSMETVLPMLAAALPVVIDALTPKGQVPDQASLNQGVQSLRRRLG